MVLATRQTVAFLLGLFLFVKQKMKRFLIIGALLLAQIPQAVFAQSNPLIEEMDKRMERTEQNYKNVAEQMCKLATDFPQWLEGDINETFEKLVLYAGASREDLLETVLAYRASEGRLRQLRAETIFRHLSSCKPFVDYALEYKRQHPHKFN